MSVKRTATTDLNHENWDQEDPTDPEEMGSFKAAPKDVLEKRVIRTAKRRTQASGDEAKKSVFSGFGGFNKTQPSSFDFLANLTNGSKNTNGTSTKSDTAVTSSLFSSKPAAPTGGLFGTNPPSTSATPFGSLQTSPFASSAKTEIPSMTFTGSKADSTVSDSTFKIQSVSSSADTNTEKRTAPAVSSTIFGVSSTSTNQTKSLTTNTSPFKQPVSSTSTMVQNSAGIASQSNSNKNESANDKPETEREKARNKYYSKLKGLNESVSSWIMKHVEKTPLCFLTPIFKDYENYLKEIQAEYEAAKLKEETMTKESQNKPDTSNASAVQSSLFGSTNTGSSLFSNSSKTPLKANDATKANAGFSFGITSTTNSATAATSSKTLSTTTPTKGFSFETSNAANSQTKSTSSFAITTSTSTSTPSKGFSFGTMTSTQSATSPTISSAFATNADEATASPSKGFSFGSATTASSSPSSSLFTTTNAASADTTPSKGFSFGITSTPSASTLTNSATTTSTGSAPFSFGIGSGAPFSFSSQTQQNKSTEQNQSEPPKNDEEDDQPPKVEYTPVVEENSVYDKRCKIFVKKDGNFVDKGVGTLYIKKVEESGKHQLLVRANTNLGTVLLNLILASAIPVQRMGKNNVMLACIPTPDAEPPPTPVLIRVKTGEEADELLETLNKYKS